MKIEIRYSLDSLAKDYLNDEKYKGDLKDKARRAWSIRSYV